MNPEKTVVLQRDCDSIEIPSGTHRSLPAGTRVRIMQSLGGSYTVTTDVGAMYRIDARDSKALGIPTPPQAEAIPAELSEQSVRDQLKTVFDPEIPVNIVDLGLVYSCSITPLPDSANRVDVKMTITAPGCGMANVLKADVEGKLSRLPNVKEVHVEVVFDPPWHPGMMSEAAKLQLGMDTDSEPDPRLRVL